MQDKLVKLKDLGPLLNFQDERSILKWCKENRIPVIVAGKEKYVVRPFIDMFFENGITNYISKNYSNSKEIIENIKNDDPSGLSKALQVENELTERKVKVTKPIEISRTSTEFLNKIKGKK